MKVSKPSLKPLHKYWTKFWSGWFCNSDSRWSTLIGVDGVLELNNSSQSEGLDFIFWPSVVGGGAAGVGDFWASHLNSPWLNDLHTCKKGQPLKLQNFVLKLLQIFSLECDFGTTMFIRSCIIFARPFNLFRSFIRHTWHINLRWTKLGLVITLITVITKFSFCTTHNKLKQLCIPFGPVNLMPFSR